LGGPARNPREDGAGASRRASMVPADDRRRAKRSGKRPRSGAHASRGHPLRRGGSAGLPRVLEPAEHLALPAPWFRGDGRNPDRFGTPRDADAPAAAFVSSIAIHVCPIYEGGKMTTPHSAVPPSAMLMQLIMGGCVAQCIAVAAHLGLADRMT